MQKQKSPNRFPYLPTQVLAVFLVFGALCLLIKVSGIVRKDAISQPSNEENITSQAVQPELALPAAATPSPSPAVMGKAHWRKNRDPFRN